MHPRVVLQREGTFKGRYLLEEAGDGEGDGAEGV